jgi:hypothetical protein
MRVIRSKSAGKQVGRVRKFSQQYIIGWAFYVKTFNISADVNVSTASQELIFNGFPHNNISSPTNDVLQL